MDSTAHPTPTPTTTTTPTTTPVLVWRRWRRGGGIVASHPHAGAQAYSLTPVKTSGGSYTGRYELTDFAYRSGRVEVVANKATGQALAEQWAAAGVPDDGFARLRAAWGTWHEQVPVGAVGVSVVLPGTGEQVCALVDDDVYQAAMTDPERRIPVEELRVGAFHPDAVTKQVPAPVVAR